MLFVLYGGVWCIEGDKIKWNSDEDDSEFKVNYVFFSDYFILFVMFVLNIECMNYYGI